MNLVFNFTNVSCFSSQFSYIYFRYIFHFLFRHFLVFLFFNTLRRIEDPLGVRVCTESKCQLQRSNSAERGFVICADTSDLKAPAICGPGTLWSKQENRSLFSTVTQATLVPSSENVFAVWEQKPCSTCFGMQK